MRRDCLSTLALASCFSEDLFIPDLEAQDKESVMRELVDRLVQSGRIRSHDVILNTVRERERTWTTAIGSGVAVPHARSLVVRDMAVVFGRSKSGIEFGADDGPVHLFFLIVAPYQDKGNRYLPVLGGIVQLVADDGVREQLMQVGNFDEFGALLGGAA